MFQWGLDKLNAKFMWKCGRLRLAKELLEEEEEGEGEGEMVAVAASLADTKAGHY